MISNVYLDGKRVTREELRNYEIKSERIKQIFLQALRNGHEIKSWTERKGGS